MRSPMVTTLTSGSHISASSWMRRSGFSRNAGYVHDQEAWRFSPGERRSGGHDGASGDVGVVDAEVAERRSDEVLGFVVRDEGHCGRRRRAVGGDGGAGAAQSFSHWGFPGRLTPAQRARTAGAPVAASGGEPAATGAREGARFEGTQRTDLSSVLPVTGGHCGAAAAAARSAAADAKRSPMAGETSDAHTAPASFGGSASAMRREAEAKVRRSPASRRRAVFCPPFRHFERDGLRRVGLHADRGGHARGRAHLLIDREHAHPA